MKQDKIVIKEPFFVQIVVGFLTTFLFFQDLFNALWKLPLLFLLITCTTMYFNMVSVAYKLKHKGLPKFSWCFDTSFVLKDILVTSSQA